MKAQKSKRKGNEAQKAKMKENEAPKGPQKAKMKGNEAPKDQNEGPKPQIFEKEKLQNLKGKLQFSARS